MSGNINSELYLNKLNQNVVIYTQHFNNWFNLKNTKHVVKFVLLEEKQIILNTDTVLYFWPKDKIEATFHLKWIFSLLPKKSSIFLIGEKNSGINTAQNLLKKWIKLEKIDSAKHCLLFFGKIIVRPKFQFNKFIYNKTWNFINIKTIPGIFSYNKIDAGSKLLASTFTKLIKGNVLDIGCGSGILSALLARHSKKVKLTLIDTNIAALESSRLTLKSNNIKGDIFPSNVYSNVHKKFNLIMSNPPLHNNLKINLNCINTIITNSMQYLKLGGEIRIVINSNVSCRSLFKNTFSKYNILKKNINFKVYQAYKERCALT
ncbi:MAG: 16S rRNA (guanine(1207)-N(2))-methyltransferase RsmC [Buchnera aphidicola (Meitanaphis elongallis)]